MAVTRVQLVSNIVGNVSGGASFTGIVTATGGFSGSLTGTASASTYASSSGIATYASSAGISTYASSSGIATYASSAGIATVSQGLTGTPSITVTNATINGTLSVGGTSVILNAATLQINDRDIVVGYTTNASNQDASTDTTAIHGGIAVASTEGNPLINIPLATGINSNPTTYKQFMWIGGPQRTSYLSGFGTDSWLSNYPISIGTTTIQNQSLFTVGAGFTVYSTYVDASSIDIRTKNINASGVSTFSSIVGTALSISGIGTITDTRIQSVGEKTTLVPSGTSATLTYNTGGGNIAICTSPSGDITLNVTGIPTDSSFNNTAITFSVFINQTGTARSCTAVNLNGYSSTIRWAGGSLGQATSGVTTSNGMDIYSFTGINTVGSANTTSNYYVMGVVNGGYR